MEIWISLKECIDKEISYFLKYKDFQTDRIYVSGIDPEIGANKDVILAVAWKFGLNKEEYENIIYHS